MLCLVDSYTFNPLLLFVIIFPDKPSVLALLALFDRLLSYSRALCRLVFCTSVRRLLFSVSAAIDIVALFKRIILVLVSTTCTVFICDIEFRRICFIRRFHSSSGGV